MDAACRTFPGLVVRRRSRRAHSLGLALVWCAALASTWPLGGCRAAGAAEGTEWTLAGEPVARKEALEFSGATCAPDGRCLLVGDEGRRARFFTIEEATGERPKIVIGAPVPLVPAEGDGEADAEAAAFDGSVSARANRPASAGASVPGSLGRWGRGIKGCGAWAAGRPPSWSGRGAPPGAAAGSAAASAASGSTSAAPGC